MNVVINGLPVNIEFNFAGRSAEKIQVIQDCMVKNKPFVLLTDEDKDFECFVPELLASFDNYKQVVIYESLVAFQIALGFCVVAYDYAAPIHTGINAMQHLQLQTSSADPALSPGYSINDSPTLKS